MMIMMSPLSFLPEIMSQRKNILLTQVINLIIIWDIISFNLTD